MRFKVRIFEVTLWKQKETMDETLLCHEGRNCMKWTTTNLFQLFYFSQNTPKYEIDIISERFLSEFGPMKQSCVFPGCFSLVDFLIKLCINLFTLTKTFKEGLIGTKWRLVNIILNGKYNLCSTIYRHQHN